MRHTGNVVDDVIDASWRVVDASGQVMERISEYKALKLSQPEVLAFGRAALQLRWGDDAPVTANRALGARRHEDFKDDLWTTFNRVQENLVMGGMPGRAKTGRRMTTREVGGVNENVKLNKALWVLADTLAQAKSQQGVDEFVAKHEHAYL